WMDVRRCRRQRADVHAYNKNFAIAHDDVAFLDLHMAGTDSLDLPAFKHKTGFETVFDEVIVGCLAVVDNAHESKGICVEGKIITFYTFTEFDAYSPTLRSGPIQQRTNV